MREAGNSSGGAARQFYLRYRTILLSIALSVVGIATGTATAQALLQDSQIYVPAKVVNCAGCDRPSQEMDQFIDEQG